MTEQAYTHMFSAFNTQNTVLIYSADAKQALQALNTLEAKCAYFERLFSHTLLESSLVRINNAGGKPVTVEAELATLLRQALHYCEATNGLFDITMAPVVALWKDSAPQQGERHSEARLPSAAARDEALSHVNWQHVQVDDTTVQLLDAHAAIVLGGIAKGYIADALIALLQEHGIEHGFVNLGGNVAVFGGKPDGSPWNVGLRVPKPSTEGDEQSFAAVQLVNGSVVTSGIYERCYTLADGSFFHHILDPHTGMPAETDLASVTLISAHSIDGDGYTTALVIMGLARATAFVEALPGCEAVFVTRDNQVFGTSGIGTAVPFQIFG